MLSVKVTEYMHVSFQVYYEPLHPGRRQYRRYPPENLEKARQLVEGGMPTKIAAEMMGVPRRTLHDYIQRTKYCEAYSMQT